jgi:hypothetical protein
MELEATPTAAGVVVILVVVVVGPRLSLGDRLGSDLELDTMGRWLHRLWAAADPRRLLLGFALRSTETAPGVIRDVDIGRRIGLSGCLIGREPHVGRHYVTTGPRGVIGTGVVLLTDASASSERLPQEPIRPVSRSVLPSKKIAVS